MSETTDASTVRLRLPARAEYLIFTRLVLTGLSRTIEIDTETLSDLKLAVSEACSYVIRADTADTLAIRYELGDDAISVEVTPEPEPPTGQVADQTESDLGLAIIEALTDELDLQQAEDGRIERLFFRKRLEPSS